MREAGDRNPLRRRGPAASLTVSPGGVRRRDNHEKDKPEARGQIRQAPRESASRIRVQANFEEVWLSTPGRKGLEPITVARPRRILAGFRLAAMQAKHTSGKGVVNQARRAGGKTHQLRLPASLHAVTVMLMVPFRDCATLGRTPGFRNGARALMTIGCLRHDPATPRPDWSCSCARGDECDWPRVHRHFHRLPLRAKTRRGARQSPRCKPPTIGRRPPQDHRTTRTLRLSSLTVVGVKGSAIPVALIL